MLPDGTEKGQDELIYSQALMDGILFGYWVALIGRGVEKIKV